MRAIIRSAAVSAALLLPGTAISDPLFDAMSRVYDASVEGIEILAMCEDALEDHRIIWETHRDYVRRNLGEILGVERALIRFDDVYSRTSPPNQTYDECEDMMMINRSESTSAWLELVDAKTPGITAHIEALEPQL